MSKLNSVLLVDDSNLTNFYNMKIIQSIDKSTHVYTAENGLQAIEFLSKNDSEQNLPNIILLDLNMPVMNGFEFIDNFEKLSLKDKSKILIICLTSSNREDDFKKITNNKYVKGFIEKPLQKNAFKSILSKYQNNNTISNMVFKN